MLLLEELRAVSRLSVANSFNDEKVSNTISFEDTVLVVMSLFKKVNLVDVLSPSRCREFVIPRQFCMYFLSVKNGVTLKEIGKYFSNRDHSTVCYAITSVRNHCEFDKEYKEMFYRISFELMNYKK